MAAAPRLWTQTDRTPPLPPSAAPPLPPPSPPLSNPPLFTPSHSEITLLKTPLCSYIHCFNMKFLLSPTCVPSSLCHPTTQLYQNHYYYFYYFFNIIFDIFYAIVLYSYYYYYYYLLHQNVVRPLYVLHTFLHC